ncbi:cell division topological specificity factor MinE [Suttonella ornithocola]|uniref:Cell division topological specificity factor n=1 Tax=Suttonella ornithocola TaxID=279832 RepID=A0A380MKW8_9GAMM|nr:cell division topological specificity factor MinE [Suttonella ornithocola]SUO93299.1 Cell division topological specificity factor [Suttonella ornithocola]
MSIFDLFKKPAPSAKIAKERLQIIVAHQRDSRVSHRNEQPPFMEAMKQEILEVVQKYIAICPEDIEAIISKEGDMDVLALNINLPEKTSSGYVTENDGNKY